MYLFTDSIIQILDTGVASMNSNSPPRDNLMGFWGLIRARCQSCPNWLLKE